MSKLSEHKERLQGLLANRTPIVFIQTTDYIIEMESLRLSVLSLSGIFDFDVEEPDFKEENIITWSPGLGFRQFFKVEKMDERWKDYSLTQGIKTMAYDLGRYDKRLLVIEDLYHIFDRSSLYTDESYIDISSALLEFYKINRNKEDNEDKSLIIIISKKFAIPQELSSCITTIEAPLPDEKDIAQELGLDVLPDDLQKDLNQKRSNKEYNCTYEFPYKPDGDDKKYEYDEPFFINQEKGIVWYESQKKVLISSLIGMQISQIRSVMASEDNTISTSDTLARIKQGKERIVRESGLLRIETVNQDYEKNIGDIEGLMRYIDRKKKVFDKKIYYKLPLPKGVLLVGPPGCGKSETSRAIASKLEMPLLSLDMGSLLGNLVGDSEHNFENALAIAEAAQPCVLWIDEIEKAFAGADAKNNDDTMTRILGYLLTWMQEREKRKSCVFIVATANDLSTLRPEFLRKGRWDEIFYLTYPSADGAWKILQSCLKRHGLELGDERFVQKEIKRVFAHYAEAKISGADISYLVQQLYEKSFCQLSDKGVSLEEDYSMITIDADALMVMFEKLAEKNDNAEIEKIINKEIMEVEYQLLLNSPNAKKQLGEGREKQIRALAKKKAEYESHKKTVQKEREKELLDLKISALLSNQNTNLIQFKEIEGFLGKKYDVVLDKMQQDIQDDIESTILSIQISMLSQEPESVEYKLPKTKEEELRKLLWKKYKPESRTEIEDNFKSKGFQSASSWNDDSIKA